MSDEEKYPAFRKIPRLFRQCIISEKLDGTNGQIYIGEDEGGPFIRVGSRSRWLTPGKNTDNYGFAQWAQENADSLMELGPGRHYGEWWGDGIQRRYGQDRKRFALFNVTRFAATPPPSCVDVVPVLYVGPFSTEAVDETLTRLRVNGSAIAPGFMEPEGVVVYLLAAEQLFKVTFDDDGRTSSRNKRRADDGR